MLVTKAFYTTDPHLLPQFLLDFVTCSTEAFPWFLCSVKCLYPCSFGLLFVPFSPKTFHSQKDRLCIPTVSFSVGPQHCSLGCNWCEFLHFMQRMTFDVTLQSDLLLFLNGAGCTANRVVNICAIHHLAFIFK